MSTAENQAKPSNPGLFNHRLESLRGIAALAVAVGHSLDLFMVTPSVSSTIALSLFNGKAAVTVFFVLSGYVLGLSLKNSKLPPLQNWLRYSARRVFRLWPALAFGTAMVLLAYLVTDAYSPVFGPGEKMTFLNPRHLSWKEILRDLLLQSSNLNSVTWTLRIELGCSLALPLLHWFSLRFGWKPRWALLALFMAASTTGSQNGNRAFLYFFYAGYLLTHADGAWRAFQALSAAQRTALTIAAIFCCLGFRHIDEPPMLQWFRPVEVLGAGLIVLILAKSKILGALRIFDLKPVRLLGEVSYSFYLFHAPCLLLLGRRWTLWFPREDLASHHLLHGLALAVTSTAVAVPIAWFSYSRIEKPLIRFAKESKGLNGCIDAVYRSIVRVEAKAHSSSGH